MISDFGIKETQSVAPPGPGAEDAVALAAFLGVASQLHGCKGVLLCI